ncbi:MAG: hypothetical protein IT374_16400 [Polyangiaceae bacterium]|nr:hypothetical protein [Polyangiaceae bacterium]
MSQAAASASVSSRSLREVVDGGGTYADISALLDAQEPAARLAEVLSITGARVGKLYAAVADGPKMTMEDFFPASVPDGETLIYEGRNSLAAFTRFQKRFHRQAGVIVGYNHQQMSFVTGPGYFVTTLGDETHPHEILFDYTAEPPHVPAGWPAYKPNASGLSRLVYFGMKDYCRKVATGVVVGEAFKQGKPAGAFFSLTRGQ